MFAFGCAGGGESPSPGATVAGAGIGTAGTTPTGTDPGGGAPGSAGTSGSAGSSGGGAPSAGMSGSSSGVPEPEPEPGDASFSDVQASASALGVYETVSVTFRSTIAYDSNPFDPEDIKADLVATAPDGSTVVMPAFFKSGSSGDATWQAYFTPRQQGRYRYRARITRAQAAVKSNQLTLDVAASDKHGFLHISPTSFYNLVFDSGKRFRGVGENYGWETDKYKFADMLPRLKTSKVNFIRTWEGPGRYALQHGQQLSHYDAAVADKLDQVMKLARDNGIYVMSTLEPAIYFLTTPHGGDTNIQWSANPFSAAKGGPAASTADFFTNAAAKRHYKNKLRYSIARWGADPHLAVWELWNEYDHLVEQLGVPTAAIAAWHKEMAVYLRETDPYDRIITTSLSHNDYADLWNLPEMQFSQRHLYGSMDTIHDTFASYETKYQTKPFVAGEFSLDWRWPQTHTPAEYGRELHMAMWRGMFAPTPILPMTWWWDFHADNDQYFHFEHVSTLAEKTAEGPGPLEPQAATASANIDALALKSPAGRFVWVHNRSANTVSGGRVTLTDMPAGTFTTRSFDTWSGAWGEPQTLPAANGAIPLDLPALPRDADMAYWLSAP